MTPAQTDPEQRVSMTDGSWEGSEMFAPMAATCRKVTKLMGCGTFSIQFIVLKRTRGL